MSLLFEKGGKKDKGVPIALVKGGGYDGEVLYLHEKGFKSNVPKEITFTKYEKEFKKFFLPNRSDDLCIFLFSVFILSYELNSKEFLQFYVVVFDT